MYTIQIEIFMISYLIGDYEVFPAPDSATALVAPSANKCIAVLILIFPCM